jgi:hypothetical protein
LSDTVDWQKVFSFGKQINYGIIDHGFLLKFIHRNILYLYILEGGGGGGFYSNGRSNTYRVWWSLWGWRGRRKWIRSG